MRLMLTADTFPPMRSSGANQLKDLAVEISQRGHELVVVVPAPDLDTSWRIEKKDGSEILWLKAFKTKDVNFIRRSIAEFLMPLLMWFNFRKSPVIQGPRFEGVIWYSPSIFIGVFALLMMKRFNSRGYLILRDIFPEWVFEMGLMKKRLTYYFFKFIASLQYRFADVIAVQSPGNLSYFQSPKFSKKTKVLPNWLSGSTSYNVEVDLAKTKLAGRKVFVYAGNMGLAQDMEALLTLAKDFESNKNVGFLFVGRGTQFDFTKEYINQHNLTNAELIDEINPEALPALYSQCCVGLITLDKRHKSHNIPGKFLSYLQSGLPVLAYVNPGNDIESMINDNKIGYCTSTDIDDLKEKADLLLKDIEQGFDFKAQTKGVFLKNFTVEKAATSILDFFSSEIRSLA